MKKHLCIAAAACGLFSLASCSDDENVIVDQPIVAEGEQVISLDVQNTDVLSTKSRPLYSTENKGAEDVSHVILYVFKSENGGVYKYDKQFSITDWNTTSTDYIYGRKRAFSIPKDEKLELGAKYMIFAVGQNEQNAASQIPAPFKFGDSTSLLQQLIGGDASELAGGTEHTWPNATGAGEGILTTNAVSYEIDDASKNNKKVVSEIFSGVSTEIDLSDTDLDNDGFNTTVLLKRQVAGVLGYFSRIPAVFKDNRENAENGAYISAAVLRLVSNARNTNVDMSMNLDQQTDDVTEVNPEEADMVVNGFTATDATNEADAWFGVTNTSEYQSGDSYTAPTTKNAYVLYQVDLTKWFNANETGQDKGLWENSPSLVQGEGEADDFFNKILAASATDPNQGWVNAIDPANAMPKVATGSILAGEFVIPFSKVEGANPETQPTFELQLLDSTATVVLKTWKVNLDAESQTAEDTKNSHNVYRNHLYQIGLRGSGDSPEEPGKDPDKPQPLDKLQELTIKINDNWEYIHNMEID